MEFIKKYYGLILLAVVIVMSVFMFTTCSSLKHEKEAHAFDNKMNEQNRLASTEALKKEYNKKIQAYEYSKAAYILDLKNLEQYNKGLYDTIRKLKGKISVLIASQGKVEFPTVTLDNKLIRYTDPNHYGLRTESHYEDPGVTQNLAFTSKFYVIPNEKTKNFDIKTDSSVIDTNKITFKVMYGMRELDKQWQIFATSPSPRVEISDLTGGYFLDKPLPVKPERPKHWAIGPYIGIGLCSDLNGTNIRAGWSLGFSLHYDIVQWRMPWEKKY